MQLSLLLHHIIIQTIQPHDGISMYRSYCIRPSAMLSLGQWVVQCNLTMLGSFVLVFLSLSSLSHVTRCLAFITSIIIYTPK